MVKQIQLGILAIGFDILCRQERKTLLLFKQSSPSLVLLRLCLLLLSVMILLMRIHLLLLLSVSLPLSLSI